MAFPPHIDIAVKMLPHLIETAKAGKKTSYEELGQAMGIQSRLFAKPLAFIRDQICVRHNLPPLTVIVENKGSDRAINSFGPTELQNLSAADYQKLKEEMLAKVYAYPKWDMALEGLLKMYCVT